MTSQPSTASWQLASCLTVPFRGMLHTGTKRLVLLSPNGSSGACTPEGDYSHSITALHGAPAASDMSEALLPVVRPDPYLLIFPAPPISVSLWRFVTVVRGRRITLLDWHAGAWSSREGKVDPRSPPTHYLAQSQHLCHQPQTHPQCSMARG
jgi:hypothetical protein